MVLRGRGIGYELFINSEKSIGVRGDGSDERMPGMRVRGCKIEWILF